MKNLPVLQPGDSIEIIAPASRCQDDLIHRIEALLSSWQLKCIIHPDIFGDDLLCANTDTNRFHFLKSALLNPHTKAILCARGGYGSMRLIPELSRMTPPEIPKLFIGMSDITALNLFFQQKWLWPTVHGALALDKFSKEAITAMQSLLLGQQGQLQFDVYPLNAAAQENRTIHTSVTGGNLCLVQASVGTTWQLDGREKIILLEEIAERGYRIDRMLSHLQQAGILNNAAAILLGDFIGGEEPNGTSLVDAVLKRFAESSDIPVVQVKGVGHGYDNVPMPLGIPVTLTLGEQAKLVCDR